MGFEEGINGIEIYEDYVNNKDLTLTYSHAVINIVSFLWQ